ncbi:GPI-anchored wall transfer protein 1 [Sphaceloma murrayae]|uniref:GPI-anchored wall transfer protein n=1 Tax=Sphaceloma murrayae TaxID=2082308 RepID=A0A2K1R2T6_9PEZI|nr:GPI-anchored wall transfer protein 1 [Sphaceloma murrayae]
MVSATGQAADEENYKKLKEAFVSDHYGGSLWEINKITLVAPAAVLLWSMLQVRRKLFEPYSILAYLADFLINGAAILFAVTVYSDKPMVLNGLVLLPALFIQLNHSSAGSEARKGPKKPPADLKDGKKDDKKTDSNVDLEVIDPLPVKPFVTHYRGAMLTITSICILAVDFPVFPRRFAKTESLGTSLMDLGVGSFVFAAGVVSVRQLLKEENGDVPRISFAKRFLTSIRHSIPLVALGLLRLYSVKKLDYAEHVTEYGVHWNFFFTLAMLGPFTTLFHPLIRLIPTYASFSIIGYVIMVIMEMLFTYSDLLSWVVFAPRDDFINANKEGIVSIPGYVSIFMAGQTIGMSILSRDQDPDATEAENDLWLAQTLGGEEKLKEMKRSHRRFAWINLAKYGVISCILYYFHTGYYGPRLIVSRRFANLAYFLWVCMFNTVQIWIFCTVESLFFPDIYQARHKIVEKERVKRATSRILGAFNRNGLAVFLLANLLTGLVNMTLRTIDMADVPAMGVLLGYLAVLTGTALTLDHFDISIKL